MIENGIFLKSNCENNATETAQKMIRTNPISSRSLENVESISKSISNTLYNFLKEYSPEKYSFFERLRKTDEKEREDWFLEYNNHFFIQSLEESTTNVLNIFAKELLGFKELLDSESIAYRCNFYEHHLFTRIKEKLRTEDQEKNESTILKFLKNKHLIAVLPDIKRRQGGVGSDEELVNLVSDVFQLISKPDIVSFLIEVANTKHEDVRDEIISFNAIQLLGYVENLKVFQLLINLLDSPKEWDIEISHEEVILTSIAKIGGKEALKFFKISLFKRKIERSVLISVLDAFIAYNIPRSIPKSLKLDYLIPELFEIVEELVLGKNSSYVDRKNSLHLVNELEICGIINKEKKMYLILEALKLAENIEMNLHSMQRSDFDGRISSPVDILTSREWLDAKIELGKNSESIPLLMGELSKIEHRRIQDYNTIRFVRALIDVLGFVEYNKNESLKMTVYQELSKLTESQVFRERALTALFIRWKIWDYPKPIVDDSVKEMLEIILGSLNEEIKKTATKFCDEVLFKWGKRYELIGSNEISEAVEYYLKQNLEDKRRIINFLFWIGGAYSLSTLDIIRKIDKSDFGEFIYSEFRKLYDQGKIKLCRIHNLRKKEGIDFCSTCIQSVQWYSFLKKRKRKKPLNI